MAGARIHWIIAVSGLVAAAAASLAASPPPVLVIHVDDRAAVPPRELAAAKIVVERTFKAAGVEVKWTEGRFPMSVIRPDPGFGSVRHAALMLVNNNEKSTHVTTGCALGFAAPSHSLAYAFYNRIVDAVNQRPADLTLVLGRVIAHEIGHLLLPANSHSRYGIMRADLDLGYSNPDQFTKEQAQTLRARVASGPTAK